MLSTYHLFLENKNIKKVNVNNINYIECIEKYNIPKDQCVLVGSALFRAYGLIKENDDLDVVVSPKIFSQLKNHNDFHQKENIGTLKTFNSKFEILDTFNILDMSFLELKRNSIKVQGYLFASPQVLLKMYQKLNRPKDQEKIKLINKYF